MHERFIEKPQLSRRQMFKRTGNLTKACAGLATIAFVGNEGMHEKKIAETGVFETDLARWHPIYERHDQHEQTLIPQNIPSNLDVLSLEGSFEKVFENDPLLMLTSSMSGQDTSPPSSSMIIPDKTLQHIKKNNIPVGFGDLDYTNNFDKYLQNLSGTQRLRETFGKILIISGVMTKIVGTKLKTQKIDRRGFLQVMGVTMSAIGLVDVCPVYLRNDIHEQLMKTLLADSPQQRLWARINTMVSNLTPENLNGLFRELVQANKLIQLAKDSAKTHPERKPEIGYNWHLGHRGIEDWVRLGEKTIRNCILAFPDDMLRQVITANNNDPRALYANRLLYIPQSLKIIQSGNGGFYSFDKRERLRDRIITDNVLAEKLKERGLS